MGKLTNIRPRLGLLPGRLGWHADKEGHSRVTEAWRAWYNTAEWRALKAEVHVRDLNTCQCGCGVIIQHSRERIADHKRPHRGDRRLFFDPNNIQTLWKPCHDRVKQREERRTPLGGGRVKTPAPPRR